MELYHRPLISLIVVTFLTGSGLSRKYEPTWESLDARPLPAWYDQSKFGIFIHWGVYSVPSYSNEWFWYAWHHGEKDVVRFMENNFPAGFTYADFAPMFTAEFYDPDAWAQLLQASGAKYVVLTSKHHEGFCNWPTKYSWNWNSHDTGPHRDLVGDLAAAIRNRTDLQFGLYHSLIEWFNPLYLQDKRNHYETQRFVKEKTMPELYELVNTYKPDLVWSDGCFGGTDEYWNSTHFLAWLYNHSPVKDMVVTNDRWGDNGIKCKHGGYWTCKDNFFPGKLLSHKWERCLTMTNTGWGYSRRATLNNYLTTHYIIRALVEAVSCGGNLLLNIGPTHDGRITPMYEERLREVGAWLRVNGQAIYSSQPWTTQNDTVSGQVWYTAADGCVFAAVLSWPEDRVLKLGSVTPTNTTTISMLGHHLDISWERRPAGGIIVHLPQLTVDTQPTRWAKVLKLQNIS